MIVNYAVTLIKESVKILKDAGWYFTEEDYFSSYCICECNKDFPSIKNAIEEIESLFNISITEVNAAGDIIHSFFIDYTDAGDPNMINGEDLLNILFENLNPQLSIRKSYERLAELENLHLGRTLI